MTNRILSCAAGATLAVFMAHTAEAASLGQLTASFSTMVAEVGLSNAPSVRADDPSVAEVTLTSGHALADLASGQLRSSASMADTWAVDATAVARSQLIFLNTGVTNVSFAAGSVRAQVDASYGRTLGLDQQGMATTVFSVVFSGTAPGVNGAAGASVVVQEANRVGWPVFYYQPGVSGGFTLTGSANATLLDLDLTMPAFTLQPGESLDLRLGITSVASAGGTAGLGWSAFVDAEHTAQLAMVLPAGVELLSAQPLNWVTTVPEPATAWLLPVGLLLVLRRCRRRAAVSYTHLTLPTSDLV